MTENSKYIEKILSMFLQYGIKSISMDDIAHKLGTSKKRLYHIFKDKTDIVNQSTTELKALMKKINDEYSSSPLNVIEKEIEYQNRYIDAYLKIKATFVYDLKKFYPDIFLDLAKFKKELLFTSSAKYVQDGIDQGLFRSDIDPNYIAKLSVTLSFAFFHPDLNEINEQDLVSCHFYNQHFLYHMNGLCSEKGRKVLDKLLKEGRLKNDEDKIQ